MKKLLFIAVLIGQISFERGCDATELELLATKADTALKGMDPQRIFTQEEARALAEAVVEDMQDNKGSAVVHLLRNRAYDSPGWQIVTQKIIEHPYMGAEPTRESLKTVESIFTATIKQGEHWLYYSPPRGWNSPHRLRSQLARVIVQASTGKDEMVDNKLLLEDPAAWFVKHGVNQNDVIPTSPVSNGKDETPPETASKSPASTKPSQMVPTAQVLPISPAKLSPNTPLPPQADTMPRYFLWLGGGALAVIVMAWIAWKKRRKA